MEEKTSQECPSQAVILIHSWYNGKLEGTVWGRGQVDYIKVISMHTI